MHRNDYIKMIKSVEEYNEIDLDGNVYEVPKEILSVALNDTIYFLAPKEFWQKHCETIINMSFEDRFGDVEDEDWEKIATVDIAYRYRFELKDNGIVSIGFASIEDGFGQADIQEESKNAILFDAYINSDKFSDIDKFISDFNKMKEKKKKTVTP